MSITSLTELFDTVNKTEPTLVNNCLVKEIVNCTIDLSPATLLRSSFKHRHLDWGYIAAQLAWYLRATPQSLDGIDLYSRAWSRILEPDINSNYGIYCFGEMQWAQAVLNRLSTNPSSRQAIILFNRPSVNLSATSDHICTTSLQFIIRYDQLNLIVTMRSNDLWSGFCHDMPFFVMLQHMTLVMLRQNLPALTLGAYFHNVGSMHAYEKDWAMINDVVNNPAMKQSGMPELESIVDARAIINELGPSEESLRFEVAGAFHSPNGPEECVASLKAAYVKKECPVFSWHIVQIIDKLCQIYSSPSGTTPPPLHIVAPTSSATSQSG